MVNWKHKVEFSTLSRAWLRTGNRYRVYGYTLIPNQLRVTYEAWSCIISGEGAYCAPRLSSPIRKSHELISLSPDYDGLIDPHIFPLHFVGYIFRSQAPGRVLFVKHLIRFGQPSGSKPTKESWIPMTRRWRMKELVCVVNFTHFCLYSFLFLAHCFRSSPGFQRHMIYIQICAKYLYVCSIEATRDKLTHDDWKCTRANEAETVTILSKWSYVITWQPKLTCKILFTTIHNHWNRSW